MIKCGTGAATATLLSAGVLTGAFAHEISSSGEQQALAQLLQGQTQTLAKLDSISTRIDLQLNRRQNEAKAKLISPDFNETEIALLAPHEVDVEPFATHPRTVDWNRVGAPAMQQRKARSEGGAFHRYTAWGGTTNPLTGKTIDFAAMETPVDGSLPKLEIAVEDAQTMHPRVRVSLPGGATLPEDATVYYEFDNAPNFEGPNHWRYPTLLPSDALFASPGDSANLTTTQGIVYHLFTTSLRSFSASGSMTFPFRVTAMARPATASAGTFEEFEKTSRIVLHGLGPAEQIREAFQYGRFNYVWGNTTIQISPIDVHRAGIAGCGAINDVMGAMLEMHGLRYRLVGGFNPLHRVWYPGGGHTGIEVHDGREWHFVDSFLDLFSPGVSAAEFGNVPIGSELLTPIRGLSHAYRTAMKMPPDRAAITVADLFKYRIYGDNRSRDGMAFLMQLRMAEERQTGITEETYGLNWPLRPAPPPLDLEKDVPETMTVHVRARYVRSRCKVTAYQQGEKCTDEEAKLSDWSTGSFEVEPRKLLKGAVPATAGAN